MVKKEKGMFISHEAGQRIYQVKEGCASIVLKEARAYKSEQEQEWNQMSQFGKAK